MSENLERLSSNRIILSLAGFTMSINPRFLIPVGFFLVVLGVVIPFLMMIHVLESTFFLNFIAFIASVSGVFFGMLGAAMYRISRNREN